MSAAHNQINKKNRQPLTSKELPAVPSKGQKVNLEEPAGVKASGGCGALAGPQVYASAFVTPAVEKISNIFFFR
jgi:hypothetical protein